MIRGLRELLLWVGAALGLLAVVAAVAVTFLGCGFLVFRSGSMSPGIPTGALALERTVSADQIRDGDVVSVLASHGTRVTHRVITTTLRGDRVTLTLKGDANGLPDAQTYTVTHAERVVVSVPRAGYVVAYLMSPPGLVVAGCVAGALLILGFAPTGGDDGGGGKTPRRGHRPSSEVTSARRRRRTGVAVTLAAAVALTGAGVTGTLAYFTDAATAASGTFTATTVTSPTLTCSGNGGTTLTITWPVVTVPRYTVTYTATLSNGTTLTITGTGATRSTTVTTAQAPGNLLSVNNYTVSVVAMMSTAPSWRSVAATQPISTFGTLVLGNMQCNAR